jgi:phage shock protein C
MSYRRSLTKSRDRRLFGVAGGIAEYAGIDPTLIRVAFVIGFFTPIPALTAYVILALIMPEPSANPGVIDVTPPPAGEAPPPPGGEEPQAASAGAPRQKRFERTVTERWIAGVCGGVGRYFEIDPVIVRALFLVAVLGFGTGILVYLVLAIIVPQESAVA